MSQEQMAGNILCVIGLVLSVKVPRSSVGGECVITTTSGSIAMEIRQ